MKFKLQVSYLIIGNFYRLRPIGLRNTQVPHKSKTFDLNFVFLE